MQSEAFDVVLTLQEKYLDKVMSGEKTVELRRRALRIPLGTRIWLYAKAPNASICAFATVQEITVAEPSVLWNTFHGSIGIDQEAFSQYFDGSELGCAISLSEVSLLRMPVSLEELRLAVGTFHPPQFSKHLRVGSPERKLLRRRAIK